MDKYLFLYLKTGGGHLAPAKAVADEISKKSKKDIEIILKDGLEYSGKFIRKILEDGYRNAVNNAIWTFEFLYALHKIKFIARATTKVVSFFIRKGLLRQIMENRPEKIVLFHFFLIEPVFGIINEYALNINILTVVTDPFTAHPVWFLNKEQNFIVFSQKLKDKCVKSGIVEQNIMVFPFVLDSRFSQTFNDYERLRVRKDLGFRIDSKVILIIGGADGIPKGKEILRNIIYGNIDADIAIVCGNNQKLYNYAASLKKRYGIDNLKVYGYIDFVYALINISDVVITKCGASTFMEILLMGKVPLINKYIWEQEKGNMEYVCHNNMGLFEKNTRAIPDAIDRLITDDNLYNSYCNNIRNASLCNGVGQVSDYILSF